MPLKNIYHFFITIFLLWLPQKSYPNVGHPHLLWHGDRSHFQELRFMNVTCLVLTNMCVTFVIQFNMTFCLQRYLIFVPRQYNLIVHNHVIVDCEDFVS